MTKNTMFKRFLAVILILMVAFVSTIKLEAADKTKQITTHNTLVGDAVTGSLWDGVNYERMYIQAERAGSYDPNDAGVLYKWDAVSVVADNNPAIKVASWGMTKEIKNGVITNVKNGYKQGTTSQIAQDYELTHPGYTVLAAINGDFFANATYTTTSGVAKQPSFDPINTWVADGGITLKKPTVANVHHNVVGIRLDRSYTYHIGSFYNAAGEPVDHKLPEKDYYYDSKGNLVTSLSIKGYGENLPEWSPLMISIDGVEALAHIASNSLSETGVNIVLPSSTGYNLDVTGYTVAKFNIDRYSVPNDGFQGKYWYGRELAGHKYNLEYTGLYLTGRSYGIDSTITTITSVENCFYVVTKEDAVKEKMAVLKQALTCQYNLAGETWGDVNSTMGTVIPFILKNTRTSYVSNANNYLNDPKPKSVIAFTKDNDAIFFFMGPGPLSGSKDKGPSSIEMVELLERLGAVDAFCLDGGGSATIVVKNSSGGFTELNSPTDSGGTRSIGNALLMIIENSNLELKAATATSATFHQSAPMADSTLKTATLHMNGKTYEYNGSDIVVNGLTKNTEYSYYFEYTYENNGKTYSTRTNTATFKTLESDVDVDVKVPTNFKVTLTENSDSKYVATVDYLANGTTVSSIKTTINGSVYELLNETLLDSTEIDQLEVTYTQDNEEKTITLESSEFECEVIPYEEKPSGGNTGDPDNTTKPGGMNCNFGAYLASSIAALGLMFIIIKKKR